MNDRSGANRIWVQISRRGNCQDDGVLIIGVKRLMHTMRTDIPNPSPFGSIPVQEEIPISCKVFEGFRFGTVFLA